MEVPLEFIFDRGEPARICPELVSIALGVN